MPTVHTHPYQVTQAIAPAVGKGHEVELPRVGYFASAADRCSIGERTNFRSRNSKHYRSFHDLQGQPGSNFKASLSDNPDNIYLSHTCEVSFKGQARHSHPWCTSIFTSLPRWPCRVP